jgi:hypothetical protein
MEPTSPVSNPPPASQPDPKTEPLPPPAKPETKPEPVKSAPGFVTGEPTGIQPGAPDGFWIYRDSKGWRLLTTTAGKITRTFKGKIWLTESKFSVVHKITPENDDKLTAGPRFIELDFDTDTGIDGVMFEFSETRCVHFELFYEGKPDPKFIRIGKNKVHPPSANFAICL